MQLQLDKLGRIGTNYPKTFFRVSCWKSDRRIADFSDKGEAEKFAVLDAKSRCYDFDHKVARMTLSR